MKKNLLSIVWVVGLLAQIILYATEYKRLVPIVAHVFFDTGSLNILALDLTGILFWYHAYTFALKDSYATWLRYGLALLFAFYTVLTVSINIFR